MNIIYDFLTGIEVCVWTPLHLLVSLTLSLNALQCCFLGPLLESLGTLDLTSHLFEGLLLHMYVLNNRETNVEDVLGRGKYGKVPQKCRKVQENWRKM